MSITTLVLIVEVILLLLGIGGFLFFWQWKAKKNKTAEVEQLLDNIRSKEAERKSILTQYLEKAYTLDNTAANELGGYMVEAEKQFLHQFLQQQVQQTSLTGFYETLCELLDQYLYFIPSENGEKVAIANDKVVDENDLDLEVIQTKSNNPKNDELNVATEESKNIETDSDKSDSGNQEQITLAEDAKAESDEPDWGAAFAESGDEIDESTKAAFDTQVKK